MEREFVSGLPDKHPPQPRTLNDALRDSRIALIERRKLEERKRLYTSRQTPQTRRITARMVGEKDE